MPWGACRRSAVHFRGSSHRASEQIDGIISKAAKCYDFSDSPDGSREVVSPVEGMLRYAPTAGSTGRAAAFRLLFERQETADQAPKGEDGSQLCSGGFLR